MPDISLRTFVTYINDIEKEYVNVQARYHNLPWPAKHVIEDPNNDAHQTVAQPVQVQRIQPQQQAGRPLTYRSTQKK